MPLEQNTAKCDLTGRAMSARPVDNQHSYMLLFVHEEAIVPLDYLEANF